MPSDTFIPRHIEPLLEESLDNTPVTALLGPRQCGKSTLAKQIMTHRTPSVYLDLERPSDLQKLTDAEWYLQSQQEKLVCLDEIQRKPELFPLLRSLIDEDRRPGRFLILGSASRDLLRQSSETLAGRITYQKLSPLLWSELSGKTSLETWLTRGGFPPSILASNDKQSYRWRQDFISTFLERDLLQFAGFTPSTMHRLWQMLAHSNGQPLNYSKIGESLGTSHTTVRTYTDLLEGTFMVRQLEPYRENTKKRLAKTPKVYLTDTGITTALLQLRNFDQASGHPVFGSLWETAVLIHITELFPDLSITYYRDNNGNEVDLILSDGHRRLAVECKASLSPSLSRSNHNALNAIKPDRSFVAAPVEEGYPLTRDINVVSLEELGREIETG